MTISIFEIFNPAKVVLRDSKAMITDSGLEAASGHFIEGLSALDLAIMYLALTIELPNTDIRLKGRNYDEIILSKINAQAIKGRETTTIKMVIPTPRIGGPNQGDIVSMRRELDSVTNEAAIKIIPGGSSNAELHKKYGIYYVSLPSISSITTSPRLPYTLADEYQANISAWYANARQK